LSPTPRRCGGVALGRRDLRAADVADEQTDVVKREADEVTGVELGDLVYAWSLLTLLTEHHSRSTPTDPAWR
jgi:hypothetical protein